MTDNKVIASDAEHAAVRVLGEAGFLGIIWADENFIAETVYGNPTDCVQVGADICQSMPALFGLEVKLRQLRQSAAEPLKLPNVRLVNSPTAGQRVSYLVTWQAQRRQYLVAIIPAIAVDETTVERQRESRRGRLAEQQLLQQTEAIHAANRTLTEANNSLKEFTHIISHDLKAPMRAMRYFTEDLEAALARDNDADASAYVSRLKALSQRMSSMIAGLLEYSRLDRALRKDMECGPTATKAILGEILSSFDIPRAFTVQIADDLAPLPVPVAILDLILRNLIENAMTHHDRNDGIVSIYTTSNGDEVRLMVADDGPGIPLELQDAVFKPFTSLRNSEDGVGMGLTLVQRAAHAAGAELALISDPQHCRGTKFVLTWAITKKAK